MPSSNATSTDRRSRISRGIYFLPYELPVLDAGAFAYLEEIQHGILSAVVEQMLPNLKGAFRSQGEDLQRSINISKRHIVSHSGTNWSFNSNRLWSGEGSSRFHLTSPSYGTLIQSSTPSGHYNARWRFLSHPRISTSHRYSDMTQRSNKVWYR